MKILYPLFLFVLLLSAAEAKQVSLNVDAATFRFDVSNICLEIYYSFPDTMLYYKPEKSKFLGELYIKIEIFSNTKKEDQKEWIVTNYAPKPVKEFKLNLVGQKTFLLPPGQYKVKLSVMDINDTATKASKEFQIIANNFPTDKMCLSDLELCQEIQSDSEKSQEWNEIFFKNTLFVIPNPNLEYYIHSPKLKAYAEIYNALKAAPGGYKINYQVLDAVNRELVSIPIERQSKSDGFVEIIEIPLEIIPTGLYFLKVLITYQNNDVINTVYKIKKFYYINPSMPPVNNIFFTESEEFEKSEFAAYSEDRVNIAFSQCKIIATKDETEQFQSLSELKAKQRFLFRFWKFRDPNPSTTNNERFEEFHKEIEYANTFFVFGRLKDGWKTDRGKILLKYGFPSNKEYVPQKNEYRSYEEWFYQDVLGGVYFYFVDVQGYNDYILVHSTMPGSVYFPDWYNHYVPSHGAGDSSTNPRY